MLMNKPLIEMSANVIMKMFADTSNEPKKFALDFCIRTYKQSVDEDYKSLVKEVFWFIVDNYVDNKEPL